MNSASILFNGKARAVATAKSVWRDWLRLDAPVMTYVAKVLLAEIMALWLSLRFEFDQPRTAMMTVAIVMQSRAGMVFSKSLYRFLGTLVGVVVSFVLVSLFAQEPILFLLCMAAWIGFCTAGSMVFRNNHAYGFVLAGYTLCIVGLPAVASPSQTFNIGTTRISEILIGLLSASLISDVVFPARLWDVLRDAVRHRFQDFSSMLREALGTEAGSGATRPALTRFMGDILNLETFRASASLENDPSRLRRLRLGQLNSGFLAVAPSYHALERLLYRQQRNGRLEVAAALKTCYTPMGDALVVEGRSARNELEARKITSNIKLYAEALPGHLASARNRLQNRLDATAQLDFETGAELLTRFVDELKTYLSIYTALNRPVATDRKVAGQALSLRMHFDPLAVALSGLMGALSLGLLATVWIITGWPSGVEAITLGVVTSTLFATSPSPTHTIRHFIIGVIIATIMASAFDFYVLPQVHGFAMLCMALVPWLVICAWMTTLPSLAIIGTSTFINFLSQVGLTSAYSTDPVLFSNNAIADLLAIALSGVMYALIDLSNSRWSHRRIAKALRRLMVTACREPLIPSRYRLEGDALDLVQRLGSLQRKVSAQEKEAVDWLLSTLEIGHAIIELRKQMKELTDVALLARLNDCLDRIARLHETPTVVNHDNAVQAIASILHAMEDIPAAMALPHATRHQLNTMLHFIHDALLDEESVLYVSTPLIAEEGSNAA